MTISLLEQARKIIWKELQSDEGLRACYLANIACMLMDAQMDYGTKLDMNDPHVRNAVATRILNHIFREE